MMIDLFKPNAEACWRSSEPLGSTMFPSRPSPISTALPGAFFRSNEPKKSPATWP